MSLTSHAPPSAAALLREACRRADGLRLVAGRVPAAEEALAALLAWLGTPGRGEWWACLEWTDRMGFAPLGAAAQVPEDLPRLVAARYFARSGDLELWRDDAAFRWRYVGAPRDGDAPGQEADLLAGPDAPVLRAARPRHALLWGRGDVQVATADAQSRRHLAHAPARLRIPYTIYYDRGAVAAVRFHGVRAESPPAAGGGKG